MKNTSLEFESIENPQDLPISTIEEIRAVSQDIWSRMDSLGELCQCPQCKTIYAAEDIFSEEQMKGKLVGELIRENFEGESIPCRNPSCEGTQTKMLFGGKHIEDIRARYTNSVKSFLVLCREKSTGNIVGFEDGYIGTVHDATKREFQHYNPEDPESINSSSDKWIHHVEQEVTRILGYTPQNILTLSSIGMLSQYKNPFIFFELLKAFTSKLPNEGEKYFALPGITEIDKRNVLYRMSLAGGAQSLMVRGNPKRMNPNYEGTLLASTHLIDTYKGFCTAGPRAFLKLLKS